jgi:hypothetical protein
VAIFVAVGFAEALSAPEVVWSLVDAGFEVAAFARKDRRTALRQSRHVTVHEITAPEEDSVAAARELSALLSKTGERRAGEHILLPLDDASLWLGAHMPLPRGWILAGPEQEQASLALDKRKQIEAARAAGFDVPETSVVSNPGELEPYFSCLPVILRPAYAASERNGRLLKGSNWICSDRAELEQAGRGWQGRGPLLVQPYLRGVGEGVFGLATAKGVVAWSAHRRLRMMNPHGSGSSACISQRVPEEMKAPAQRFITSAGWRGLFMIELLRGNDGHLWFVEFNGRTWGSMALARRQELEYPAWTVQLALDPSFSPVVAEALAGEIECRNLGRELMHLLFVLRGPKSRAVQPWPRFWRSLFDVIRLRRRSRFYNRRRDDWRVFWADAANTLRDQILKRKS